MRPASARYIAGLPRRLWRYVWPAAIVMVAVVLCVTIARLTNAFLWWLPFALAFGLFVFLFRQPLRFYRLRRQFMLSSNTLTFSSLLLLSCICA